MLSFSTGYGIAIHYVKTLPQAQRLFDLIFDQLVSWTGDLPGRKTCYIILGSIQTKFAIAFLCSLFYWRRHCHPRHNKLAQARWFLSDNFWAVGELERRLSWPKSMLYYLAIHLEKTCKYFLCSLFFTEDNITVHYRTTLSQDQWLLYSMSEQLVSWTRDLLRSRNMLY